MTEKYLAQPDLDFIAQVKGLGGETLKKCYQWYINLEKKHKPLSLIFHNIEFLILILITSIFYNIFLFILIGSLFHLITDIIYLVLTDRVGTKELLLTRYLLTKDKSKYL